LESSNYADLSHYDQLTETGAMGSLKRDILIGAADDLWFVDHIRKYFVEESGGSAADITPCTVRVIRELIAEHLVNLCTWGPGGSHLSLHKTENEILEIVNSLDAHPMEFFLDATRAGMEWVVRYRRLIDELG
jgi:hypothetical protein